VISASFAPALFEVIGKYTPQAGTGLGCEIPYRTHHQASSMRSIDASAWVQDDCFGVLTQSISPSSSPWTLSSGGQAVFSCR